MMDNICIISKDNSSLNIPKTINYRLNTDKIKTIDDIKLVLNAMNVCFFSTEEQIKPVKHLIDEF